MLTQNAIINKATEIGKAEAFVDVVKLASEVNVEVYVTNDGDDFHAKTVHDKDDIRHKIYVNGSQTLEKQRFSIAHELARLTITRGKLTKSQEEATDEMAAEILMPKKLVEEKLNEEKIAKRTPLSQDVIAKMADNFKVSQTFSALRLRSLKYFVPWKTLLNLNQ
jgi:Zn-dependent peptidase ImmA (M78 family)